MEREMATAPSLHEGTLARLRNMIVAGVLPSDGRIPERELCERLHVSRTPLREALKVLAAEGLVELLPYRGARVRRLAEAEIRSLFEVMAGLERLAGSLAAARMTAAEISAIEADHYAMYAHYMKRELPGYFRLNQKIHHAIVAGARNPVLALSYTNLDCRLRGLRYSANMAKRDRWGEAMREHEAILDALIRREAEETGRLMYDHILHKCEAACEFVREGASPSVGIDPSLAPDDLLAEKPRAAVREN